MENFVHFFLKTIALSVTSVFTVMNVFSQTRPEKLWHLKTQKPIYASPISNGKSIFIGGDDSTFRAINLQNGVQNWAFRAKGMIRSTALLYENKLYFTCHDGKLYCLDTTGKLLWAFKAIEKLVDFADYHQSCPVISKNSLYVGMGDGFYAIDANLGTMKWKFATNSPVHVTAVQDEKQLYFGSISGIFYALEKATGKQIWSFKTVGHQYFPKGNIQGSVSQTKNTVIFGARDYNVYALDKAKGHAIWNKVYTKGWVIAHTVQDSLLYLAGADERIISCTNLKTSEELWKKNMEFLHFGKPIIAQNQLFVGSTIGKVYAFDSLSGEKQWTFTTDGYVKNRLKYFKEDDTYRDDIYTIIKSNEHFLEVENELGGVFSSPLVIDNQLIITCGDGGIYCIKFK